MENPYQVLNIDPSASDEEVTRAYRALAKKYHPDLNQNNPSAGEKMRQINAAYDRIKNIRSGNTQTESAGGHHRPAGGYYTGFEDIFGDIFGNARQGAGSEEQILRQAGMYIQMHQFSAALSVLSQSGSRSAEWYYLSAVANAGIGNRVTAINHAMEAVRLNPQNPKYQQLLEQLRQGGHSYQQAGERRGYSMQGFGRSFFQLLLAHAICYCCCRPC